MTVLDVVIGLPHLRRLLFIGAFARLLSHVIDNSKAFRYFADR